MASNPVVIDRLEQIKDGLGREDNKGLADPILNSFITVQHDDDALLYATDPLYVGFKVFFHFSATSGLLASDNHVNSALAYLYRIGEDTRYELLKTFIETLSRISSNNAWMFKEVTNLSEIFSKDVNETLQSGELSIVMHESIDWRATSLSAMYRQIAYDDDRRVWVLPPNLRNFSFSIYIHDTRIFNDYYPSANNYLRTPLNAKDVKTTNHIMFDFGNCKFTPTSGNGIFQSITNVKSGAIVSSNLDIKFDVREITYLFRSLTGANKISNSNIKKSEIKDDKIIDVQQNKYQKQIDKLKKSKIFEVVQNNTMIKKLNDDFELLSSINENTWRTKLDQLQSQALNKLDETITTNLARLYLGNAEGLSVDDINNFFTKGVDYSSLIGRFSTNRNASLRNLK